MRPGEDIGDTVDRVDPARRARAMRTCRLDSRGGMPGASCRPGASVLPPVGRSCWLARAAPVPPLPPRPCASTWARRVRAGVCRPRCASRWQSALKLVAEHGAPAAVRAVAPSCHNHPYLIPPPVVRATPLGQYSAAPAPARHPRLGGVDPTELTPARRASASSAATHPRLCYPTCATPRSPPPPLPFPPHDATRAGYHPRKSAPPPSG